MKNILKKTAKFIFSRLLYLVIGIFLAIGATYFLLLGTRPEPAGQASFPKRIGMN